MWRFISDSCVLGGRISVWLLGTGAQSHTQLIPARHALTSVRILDQKGQTSIFLLEVMVEFSPCKSFRDYNLFLHVWFFSPTKTPKPGFFCEVTGSYIRLLLNHNLQILFWLQTASHFLAEDWGKPPSPHMLGHRDPFMVPAKLLSSQGKTQQHFLQAPSDKVNP